MFGPQWITTCALFVLCLGNIFFQEFGAKAYIFPPKKQLQIPIVYPIKALSEPKWPTTFDKQKAGAATRLEEAEPGFDFTEDEMEKLKIWPGGVIPYYIDDFSFDKVLRDRIRSFLHATNGITGLNFLELHRPPEDEKTRWVLFVNRQGLLDCVDHPYKDFTTRGVQKVVLGYDCLTDVGGLADVLLALVGVPPQHNAPNRGKYIVIEKENIIPGKEHLFEAMRDSEWLFHEVDYDFSSASHYPLHKYTVNGKATIQPVASSDILIGGENGFSYTDIWKIRMLYNFISKKRLKAGNIPQCKQLFHVESNFGNNEPQSEGEIVPRKKPNKYLGLPEDIPEPVNPSTDNIKPKKVSPEENLPVSGENKKPKKLTVVEGSDYDEQKMEGRERKFTNSGGLVTSLSNKSDDE